jgi:regulation of enolase protein 1 (concanavalin A-like superfamily)
MSGISFGKIERKETEAMNKFFFRMATAKIIGAQKFFCLTVVFLGCAAASRAEAQISYGTDNSTYLQTFDALPSSGSGITWTDNSTLPGWYTFRTTPNLPAVSCKPDNGSNAGSGVVYSYGDTGSSDRAMGMLPGSTPGDVMWGACFVNNTGKTLTSFVATYSGEQWRSDSTTARTMSFAYKIGTSSNLNDNTIPWIPWAPLNFTSPVTSGVGALEGNAAANRSAGISSIITGISWAPGTDLWVRFYCPAVASNQGLATDSFTFSSSDDPLATLYRESINTVATVDSQLVRDLPGLQIRDLSLAAYICLALNYHLSNYATPAAEAETYLNDMFTKQDTTAGSPTYGHFYWTWGDTTVTDENSTEFCLRYLAVIWKRYSSQLGSSYLTSITPATENALTAARTYSPPVAYSNIYTMRAQNLLLLGEALGDTTSQTAGTTFLEDWFSDLSTEYVHEYESPTYTIVTMGNLLTIANNTANVVEADKCRAILDLIGADTSANYFTGQEKMSGSHSRDYDFTTGHGDIDQFYFIEGLCPNPPAYEVEGDLVDYLNTVENGYRTPADILAYGNSTQWPTRIIKSIWGPTTATGQDRYNYMTPDFAIGSSGASYDLDLPLDKSIAADLTSTEELGQVSLVYDPYDLPYGTVSSISGTGETVVAHLKSAAIVQDHGTILSLANLSPEWNALGPYTNISAALLFPIGVSNIYLNGTQITPSGTYTAGLNSVIGVRQGNALVAARFFLIDGMKGYTPTYAVKFDDPTGMTGRLVAYLYKGASTNFDSTYKPRIGTIMAAQTCVGDTAAASFLSAVQSATITPVTIGTQWSASVTLNGTTLAAQQDVSNNATLYRTVNGASYVPAHFTVNNGGSTTVDLNKQFLQQMIGSGWVLIDLGSLPAASTASYNTSAAVTTITSTSGDFWNATDAGSFTYRPVTGNCDVIARVDSQTAANQWSKAGVMIRETLAPGATCATTYVTPGEGVRFSYRPTTGAAAQRGGLTRITAPYYMRLTRVGNVFSSYVSPDGVTWTQLTTSETIPMATTVYVGFDVCSCTTTSSTAVFSHVSVH